MSNPSKNTPSGIVPREAGRQNTLDLDTGKLAQMLDRLERRAATSTGNKDKQGPSKRRSFTRWRFPSTAVKLVVEHPGGTRDTLTVAARDLSNGGISVLHSNFVYEGSACWVTLTNRFGDEFSVAGQIVRCGHFQGNVHEIGVRFDRDIDAKQYIDLDTLSDTFSTELVDPTVLAGKVLYIDDSPIDRKIMRVMLSGTRITVVEADSVEKGVELARKGCDLILCDFFLGNGTGDQVLRELRENGISTPVVGVTADTTPQSREAMRQARVNAIIEKPLDPDVLLRAVTEFVMVQRDCGPGTSSTLTPDDPAFELIDEYIADLREKSKLLKERLESADGDPMQTYSVCLQIRGTAPRLGFASLGPLADEAAKSLAASMSLEESARPLRALIDACARARAA